MAFVVKLATIFTFIYVSCSMILCMEREVRASEQVSSNGLAEDSSSSAESFTVASYNIDTNLNMIEDSVGRLVHPEWRVAARMPSIHRTMDRLNDIFAPSIWLVQEGRACLNNYNEVVDSIGPMEAYLREHGYTALIQPYHSSAKAFSYVTAFDPAQFDFVEEKAKHFRESNTDEPSPDPSIIQNDSSLDVAEKTRRINELKEANFGDLFSRCVHMVHLRHRSSNKHIWVMNIHLSLSERVRVGSCRLLQRWTQEILDQDPKACILGAGDFNYFPDSYVAVKEVLDAEETPLFDATEVYYESGAKPSPSFIFFPYDFGPKTPQFRAEGYFKELDELQSPKDKRARIDQQYREKGTVWSGTLDRVVYTPINGLEPVSVKVALTPLFDDISQDELTDENLVKSYVDRHLEDGPAFASDHQPLIVKFKLA